MSIHSIRSFLSVCALTPLVACTTVVAAPPATSQPGGGHEYRLRPGEQATLDHGHLRYVRLVNDSRCAPDVQCVWAGDAEVAFEWLPDTGARQPFSLHTGVEPREQAVGERRVRLESLAPGPAPEATVRVDGIP